MTYLQDIKKNIMTTVNPIHSAFQQANLFIDTLLDSENEDENNDNENNDYETDNSENNDENSCNLTDSDNSNTYSSDFDSDTHYSPTFYYNTTLNLNRKNLNNEPKQHNFSPIACDVKIVIENKVKEINNDNQNLNEINNLDCDIDNINNLTCKYEEQTNKSIEKPKPMTETEEQLLIDNLHILGSVAQYQKLGIEYIGEFEHNMCKLYIDNSYFPQIIRWYYNQSRNNTINLVTEIINSGLELKKYYLAVEDELNNKKISLLLDNAKNGILNLIITYSSDAVHVKKLNSLVEIIVNNL